MSRKRDRKQKAKASKGESLTAAQAARLATRAVKAKYDAAQTTAENRRHWAMADGLSANAANDPFVRRTLRNRSRYEVANNTYAKGLIRTLADDVIGTGPRLQVQTKSPDPAANFKVAKAFADWCWAVNLPAKLRLMREARAVDGEAFALLVTNPAVKHKVQLDLRLFEAEMCCTPELLALQRKGTYAVDGIEFDKDGNPTHYHVLKRHPGDVNVYVGSPLEYDRIEASKVLHWFRKDRPGQARGIPETTPSLPLYSQLRRFTLATLGAAETAADFAAILYSEQPGDDDEPPNPFEELEIAKRMMTVAPSGWKLAQLKAEHPGTTYPQFKRELVCEAARGHGMPYNVAAGDSSSYNYASGRLDHQTYDRAIAIDRDDAEIEVVDRILDAWLEEAALEENVLPEGTGPYGDWEHQWYWPGREHVDPVKEADAQAIRLESNTTTLADEWGKLGYDWEEKIEQRAREIKKLRALEITPAEALPTARDRSRASDREDEEAPANA